MKNKALQYFILLTAIIYLGTGCAAKKQGEWLNKHAVLLEQAANSKISGEKKMDILATSLTQMMHQSLNFTNPKKGAMYSKAYFEQNNANIDKILKDMDLFREDMGAIELISFALRMKNKPYTKDLIDLIPRFRRKYKTYSFLMGATNKITKGFMGLGGKALKGL